MHQVTAAAPGATLVVGATGITHFRLLKSRGSTFKTLVATISILARKTIVCGLQVMGRLGPTGGAAKGFSLKRNGAVATAAQSIVTFVACGPCGNFVSDRLFTNVRNWPNPTGNVAGNPVIVSRSMHVQGVDDSGPFARGLAVTYDLGSTWRQFATFGEDRRDIPKVARPGSIMPLMYQAYRTPGWYTAGGFEINHLLRISKSPFRPTATVYYPAMNNFGGLGINPTMFAWYQVYGADPGNPYHVIAPDVINERMMETHDGGENWTEMTPLTNLVTDGGRLRFRSWIFPIVTAVSFSPQNPQLVLVGTSEGAIFLSTDNGATWQTRSRLGTCHLCDSIRLAQCERRNRLQLWTRLVAAGGEALHPTRKSHVWCKRCEIIQLGRPEPDPLPFERAILVYEGRVQGAALRMERCAKCLSRPAVLLYSSATTTRRWSRSR